MEEGMRYIRILKESLQKKERILKNLLELTRQEEDYINNPEFDLDVFDELIAVKQDVINELDKVDEGFEVTYERIGAYLNEHKKEFSSSIAELQNQIRKITSLSVSIQKLEEQNRVKLQDIFAKKQQEINKMQKSNKAVGNYIDIMSGSSTGQSMLFNAKK